MNENPPRKTSPRSSLTWLVVLSAMGLLTFAVAATAIGAASVGRLHLGLTEADVVAWILPPPLKLWRRLGHQLEWPSVWHREPGQDPSKTRPEMLDSSPSPPLQALISQPELVADVAERVLPSVVNISTSRIVRTSSGGHLMPYSSDPLLQRFFGQGLTPHELPRERLERSLGSGVIVSAEGLVLTNHHVIEQADEIRVTLQDGSELEASVVGSDSHTDLAVLRLSADVLPPLTPLPLGDSEGLRLGQIVLAVGNPFGLSGSVTMGIVSAKGRSGMGIADYEDFVQTDAAINPGNSGGALVSLDGELVGINTAIFSRSGGSQGIGFAIPSAMARPIMDDLVEHGEVSRGWLGVYIQDLEPDLAVAMKLEGQHGALVAQVPEGSPADREGILPGDLVVSFDGESIDGSAELRVAVAMRPPGSEVELGLVRGGRLVTFEVELGDLDQRAESSEVAERQEGPLAGLSLQTLTPANRREHGVPDSVSTGLLVTGVDEGSPAWREGLRQGDVLLEANREPLTVPGDLRKVEEDGASHMLLLVTRQGATLFMAVPLS